MLDPKEVRNIVDTAEQELEKAILGPPDSEAIRFRQQLAQDIATALPTCFPEIMHATIARVVELVLSELVSRLVADGVERAIRPLAEEVARLRHIFEQESEDENWWKRGSDADPEPDPEPDPEDGGIF